MRHIALASRPRVPWRNGGGTTTVLWTTGDDPAESDVRISVAQIEADGPFSRFPGITRYQRVIRGAGFRLTGSRSFDVVGRLVIYPGDDPLLCTLHDGPVEVINVMVANHVRAVVREVEANAPFVGLAVLLEPTELYAAGDLLHVQAEWCAPVPILGVVIGK